MYARKLGYLECMICIQLPYGSSTTKLMNNKLPECFTSMKTVMPAVTERYEIRNPSFHTPTIKHKFSECSFCKQKELLSCR